MNISTVNQIGQSANNYLQYSNVTENLDGDYQSSDSNSKNQSISLEVAKKTTDKINKLLEDTSAHIEYEQDKNFKQIMIMKVVENGTNKVLKEIPSKKVLEMVDNFCKIAGLLIDGKF